MHNANLLYSQLAIKLLIIGAGGPLIKKVQLMRQLLSAPHASIARGRT